MNVTVNDSVAFLVWNQKICNLPLFMVHVLVPSKYASTEPSFSGLRTATQYKPQLTFCRKNPWHSAKKKNSLKLTADATWKWMVGRWNVLFRLAYFQGRTVGFRDGKPVKVGMLLPRFTSVQHPKSFIGKENFHLKQLRLAYIPPTYLCSKRYTQ